MSPATKDFVNYFPDKTQDLALRLALNEQSVTASERSAFAHYLSGGNYLDSGLRRLLPLLFIQVQKDWADSTVMELLEESYKETKAKNLRLYQQSREVIKFLEQYGIRSILLKGIAYSILYYKDCGLRPMNDLDLLIRHEDAKAAIELLVSNGWVAENEEYIEYNLRYGKSMMFENQEGFELDLHWFPFFEAVSLSNKESFWQKAQTLDFCDSTSLCFCDEDNLLHTIVHGLKYNPEPPIRWIPDAVYILKVAGESFDWNYFLRQMKMFRLSLQVRDAISYLSKSLMVTIPDWIILEVNAVKENTYERWVYNYCVKNAPVIPTGFFPKIIYLYMTFLQQSKRSGLELTGFSKYLRFRTKNKDKLRLLGNV